LVSELNGEVLLELSIPPLGVTLLHSSRYKASSARIYAPIPSNVTRWTDGTR
jgi:hypothetical protein